MNNYVFAFAALESTQPKRVNTPPPVAHGEKAKLGIRLLLNLANHYTGGTNIARLSKIHNIRGIYWTTRSNAAAAAV